VMTNNRPYRYVTSLTPDPGRMPLPHGFQDYLVLSY